MKNYGDIDSFFSNFENTIQLKTKDSSAIVWQENDEFWKKIKQNNGFDKFGTPGKFGDLVINDMISDNMSEYKYNSYGYRSQEFIKNPDILISGCSFTFGMGCPEKLSWPVLLSKDLNLNMVNIGYPGASVQKIVLDIFRYCTEFGNPKKIVCLFPDFYRILFAKNKKTMIDSHDFKALKNKSEGSVEFARDIQSNVKGLNYKLDKYIKTPVIIEDLIPPELTYMLAIHNIIMLEQYCFANGIDLYYSSWSPESEIAMDSIKNNTNSLKNYYSYFKNSTNKIKKIFNFDDEMSYTCIFGIQTNSKDFFNNEENFKDFCHKDLLKQNEDIFYRGTDRYFLSSATGEFESHPGTHYHAHVAEHFKELILNEHIGV